MRKSLFCFLVLSLLVMAGCVTINVYFPKAAADKAADEFVGSVIDSDTADNSNSADDNPAPAESSGDTPIPQGGPHGPLASIAGVMIPAAHAASDEPKLRVHTATVNTIHARMRERYEDKLHELLDEGVVGFTQDGLVAMRDAADIPLSKRAGIRQVVESENNDRRDLYQAIAEANDHPDWASRIRQTFARKWTKKAHDGWYVQTSSGAWKQK